jgi:cell division transport system permease protein
MTVVAVTTIMAVLLAVGAAVILGLNLSEAAASLESQVGVVAFLQAGLSAAEVAQAQQSIATLPGVTSVRAVSRTEALARLAQHLGDAAAFRDLEPVNPLPDLFEVALDDPSSAKTIASAIAEVAGVEDVSDGAQGTELLALTRGVRILAALLTLLLTAVALVAGVNVIRFTIIARQHEIEILRLVGATRWLIQWPLVFEGVLEGVVAATAATVVVAGSYLLGVPRLRGALPFLPLVPNADAVVTAAVAMVIAGVVVGTTGSLIAVRRFVSR